MEVTVNLAQAQALVATLSVTRRILWQRDPNDPTRVEIVALLDTRCGQLLCRFATDADKPSVTQLEALTGTVEVSGLVG